MRNQEMYGIRKRNPAPHLNKIQKPRIRDECNDQRGHCHNNEDKAALVLNELFPGWLFHCESYRTVAHHTAIESAPTAMMAAAMSRLLPSPSPNMRIPRKAPKSMLVSRSGAMLVTGAICIAVSIRM